MSKMVILSLLLISTTIEAQSIHKNKKDSLSININGESIYISQKRIDSLANVLLDKFSSLINDKDINQSIHATMNHLEEKFNKALDILVEDKSQLQKAKKELKKAFIEVKPSIDTAIQSLKYQIDQTKKSKSN